MLTNERNERRDRQGSDENLECLVRIVAIVRHGEPCIRRLRSRLQNKPRGKIERVPTARRYHIANNRPHQEAGRSRSNDEMNPNRKSQQSCLEEQAHESEIPAHSNAPNENKIRN